MSFDIFAMPARFRPGFIERRSPSTGELVQGRSNYPMTAGELAAVRAALRTAGATLDNRNFQLEGGLVNVVGLDEKGCMFAVHGGITPRLAEVLFKVATVGNLFYVATMNRGLIAISAEQAQGLPDDLTNEAPTICPTAKALARHLGVGFEVWDEYRRHVVAR